ncbi:MAG TPA: FecR domain-containing protein [Armatimonadota bacterium]|nr:FecR domain-containing protein [Armatimonadota bacterium]
MERSLESRKGFTLLQLVVTMGIVAVLMAAAVKSYRIARAGAMASMCESKLKTLAMDLDRYYQDHHCYPTTLEKLYPEYVKTESVLRCPCEERPGEHTYSDFYIIRASEDKGNGRLLLSCPFHQDAGKNVAVFFGGAEDDERGKVCVATLAGSGNVTVLPYDAERPKDAGSSDASFWNNAIAAAPNMEVGPGDWVRVSSGSAVLTFKDQSRAEITAPADVMVVDAFRTRNAAGDPFYYSALRLARGHIFNVVTHGSKYEVITPTGTAGAKGTEFEVEYIPEADTLDRGKWKEPHGKAATYVAKGVVYFTGRFGTVDVNSGETAELHGNGKAHKGKGRWL